MPEPQLVTEMSQTEAISSTSSNTPEGKAAESVSYRAKEGHDCKNKNYPSSKVTESIESDRGQSQSQGRHGKKQTSELDGEDILEGWWRKSALCAATSTGWSTRGTLKPTRGTCTTRKGRESSGASTAPFTLKLTLFSGHGTASTCGHF